MLAPATNAQQVLTDFDPFHNESVPGRCVSRQGGSVRRVRFFFYVALVITTVLGLSACGDDSAKVAPVSELASQLTPVTPPPGASRIDESVADDECKSMTQTYSYTGDANAVLAHYQSTASSNGWSAIGSIADSSVSNELALLKEFDGSPLFMQITVNENNTYTLLIRSAPPNNTSC